MSAATRHPQHPYWIVDPLYPDSDGEPLAESTRQYDWIVTIKGGLDLIFKDDPNVFVAADLFWYPVEGNPAIRTAPDVMVVFGRPKGHRGSYMQWREDGIAPQVVFEILSPGNRPGAMGLKRDWYERYGVEEYYIYDPDDPELTGFLRDGERLVPIPIMDGWVSPRLGVRFEMNGELRVIDPDGEPFATYIEIGRRAEDVAHERDEVLGERDEAVRQRDQASRQRDEMARLSRAERQRAEAERQRAEAERQRAEEAERRAAELAALLRKAGLDPNA